MKKTISFFVTVFSLLFIFSVNVSAQQNTSFQVGQQVEAWNVGWYKATILEIGSGKNAGYIKIHYNDYASDQYLKESSIRQLKKSTAPNYATGPRRGRYTILSYGAQSNPLTLGYIDLNNGKYIFYDAGENPMGKGSYQYDARNKMVLWQTGSLTKFGPGAPFEISREGKTHNIRLKRTTIGTNSTD